MNTDIEKAMFSRVYDGMAAKEAVSRKALTETFWLKRAEVAERHQRELVRALTELVRQHDKGFWSSWQTTAHFVRPLEVARAVLANYSVEVV